MKEKRLAIVINKPVAEVFLFTIMPTNTSLWVETIIEEETSEWPIKVGTVYRNRGSEGPWTEYHVSNMVENEVFQLTAADGNYSVCYVYTALSDGKTQIDYYEWVERGELERSFELATLEKLKSVMERSPLS